MHHDMREYTRNTGRVLYLSGEITEHAAQDVNIEMLKMQRDAPLEDIILVIDSFGGDMFAAFAIVDMMDMITCDIQTICVGKAMSAGQLIFSTGTKGKRFMSRYARLMIHNPIAGMEGSVPDIEIEIEELQRCRAIFVKHIADRSKMSEEEITNLITRNAYLDAEAAIDMGFADNIIKRIK